MDPSCYRCSWTTHNYDESTMIPSQVVLSTSSIESSLFLLVGWSKITPDLHRYWVSGLHRLRQHMKKSLLPRQSRLPPSHQDIWTQFQWSQHWSLQSEECIDSWRSASMFHQSPGNGGSCCYWKSNWWLVSLTPESPPAPSPGTSGWTQDQPLYTQTQQFLPNW